MNQASGQRALFCTWCWCAWSIAKWKNWEDSRLKSFILIPPHKQSTADSFVSVRRAHRCIKIRKTDWLAQTPAVDRAAGGRQICGRAQKCRRRSASPDRADRLWYSRGVLIAAAGVALMKLFGVLSAKFTLSSAPPMEFRRSNGRPHYSRGDDWLKMDRKSMTGGRKERGFLSPAQLRPCN